MIRSVKKVGKHWSSATTIETPAGSFGSEYDFAVDFLFCPYFQDAVFLSYEKRPIRTSKRNSKRHCRSSVSKQNTFDNIIVIQTRLDAENDCCMFVFLDLQSQHSKLQIRYIEENVFQCIYQVFYVHLYFLVIIARLFTS